MADSQQVAFQMALLISLLPTLILSGFIFPISSMPRALQLVTNLVPARYFLARAARHRPQGRADCDACRFRWWRWRLYAAAMLALASLRLARERA